MRIISSMPFLARNAQPQAHLRRLCFTALSGIQASMPTMALLYTGIAEHVLGLRCCSGATTRCGINATYWMSPLGQTEKNSLRAYVFRSSANSGHSGAGPLKAHVEVRGLLLSLVGERFEP